MLSSHFQCNMVSRSRTTNAWIRPRKRYKDCHMHAHASQQTDHAVTMVHNIENLQRYVHIPVERVNINIQLSHHKIHYLPFVSLPMLRAYLIRFLHSFAHRVSTIRIDVTACKHVPITLEKNCPSSPAGDPGKRETEGERTNSGKEINEKSSVQGTCICILMQ